MTTNKEVLEKGTIVNRWPCDMGLDGTVDSNGSQEFIVEYEGEVYWIWADWDNNAVEPEVEALKSEEI